MKKSKKLLALLLCLAMVFGLAACGNSNKPADSQTPAPDTNTETPAPETETPGETEADHLDHRYFLPQLHRIIDCLFCSA